MGPLWRGVDRAQRLGDLVGLRGGDVVGRRALQHGHVPGAVGRHGRYQRGRRGARADNDHLLPGVVQVLRPGQRVDDLPAELLRPRPLGRVALVLAVVPLAHPDEVGAVPEPLAGVQAGDLHGPPARVGGEARGGDALLVADVRAEVVLVDDFPQVRADLFGGGQFVLDPRLEAVPERVHVAVRPDPRVPVDRPRAAEGLPRLKDGEALALEAMCQVVGDADPGDAGPHHEHVEVLDAAIRHAVFPSVRSARRRSGSPRRRPPARSRRPARPWGSRGSRARGPCRRGR